MSDWNDEHHYSKWFKMQMLIAGLLIALCAGYITFLYFEYRVSNALWETTFISPTYFWSQVPDWEWRPIWQKT
jgi:hypothetical protein